MGIGAVNHRAKLNQAGSSTLEQQNFVQYDPIGFSDGHLGAALVNSSAHGGKMLFSEGRR